MSFSSSNKEVNQHGTEYDIRNLISALTSRLTAFGKPTQDQGTEEADNGVRIITLAGENKGVTMRAAREELAENDESMSGDEMAMSAYTNSNYQAINNSIALGGSIAAEDPGVHIIISDYIEEDKYEKVEKVEKAEKKKIEVEGEHSGVQGEKN